ncbi:MAG: hypothetical protein PF569_00590 [Candidatus Woesearchaeota archaeon]|nr:hypothetical protein [Candidatus Woesearchaeota archaeon]
MKKERLTDELIFDDYKQKLLTNIEKIRTQKVKRINSMFSKNKFVNFLNIYFLLFYPEIKIPLTDIVDYYYE